MIDEELLSLLDMNLGRVVRERAEAEGWSGPVTALWHEMEYVDCPGDLWEGDARAELERKKAEWREFLRGLLSGSDELRQALDLQQEAMKVLVVRARHARDVLERELAKGKLAELSGEVKGLLP